MRRVLMEWSGFDINLDAVDYVSTKSRSISLRNGTAIKYPIAGANAQADEEWDRFLVQWQSVREGVAERQGLPCGGQAEPLAELVRSQGDRIQDALENMERILAVAERHHRCITRLVDYVACRGVMSPTLREMEVNASRSDLAGAVLIAEGLSIRLRTPPGLRQAEQQPIQPDPPRPEDSRRVSEGDRIEE